MAAPAVSASVRAAVAAAVRTRDIKSGSRAVNGEVAALNPIGAGLAKPEQVRRVAHLVYSREIAA